MRQQKVMRYYCDHCSKGFWKKYDCAEHEDRCYYNSKNRACGTCRKNLKDDGPWFCSHHDKDLTPSFYDIFTKKNSVLMVKKNCEYWEGV